MGQYQGRLVNTEGGGFYYKFDFQFSLITRHLVSVMESVMILAK